MKKLFAFAVFLIPFQGYGQTSAMQTNQLAEEKVKWGMACILDLEMFGSTQDKSHDYGLHDYGFRDKSNEQNNANSCTEFFD